MITREDLKKGCWYIEGNTYHNRPLNYIKILSMDDEKIIVRQTEAPKYCCYIINEYFLKHATIVPPKIGKLMDLKTVK